MKGTPKRANAQALKKVRLVFLPFLGMALACIVVYTFLNWLLIIKTGVIDVKEDIVNFGIPFALPWVPVLIWLRPRIRLLNLKTEKGEGPFFYQMVAAMAIAVPMILTQEYLSKATGELTRLESIAGLGDAEPTKFYTLDRFFLDRAQAVSKASFESAGRNGQETVMRIHFVVPILERAADAAGSSCRAWLGVDYSEKIHNSLSDELKDARFESFAAESLKDFNERDLGKFAYLERVGNTDAGEAYRDAVAKRVGCDPDQAMVFVGVDEPFEERMGSTFAWIFGSLAIGAGIWLVMVIVPYFDPQALEQFEAGRPFEDPDLAMFLSLLRPQPGFVVTPVLFYMNTLAFLAMALAGHGFISMQSQDLLAWGANFRPLTLNGEWWRLLTCTFLHGGVMHFIANMAGLLFAGTILEPALGWGRFLVVYLLTGLASSCASIWWYEASASVGASGAVFGLCGILLALAITKAAPLGLGKGFVIGMLVFIGFNLVLGLLGGIDNAAHIGGLLSGFAIGLLLYPDLRRQAKAEER